MAIPVITPDMPYAFAKLAIASIEMLCVNGEWNQYKEFVYVDITGQLHVYILDDCVFRSNRCTATYDFLTRIFKDD